MGGPLMPAPRYGAPDVCAAGPVRVRAIEAGCALFGGWRGRLEFGQAMAGRPYTPDAMQR